MTIIKSIEKLKSKYVDACNRCTKCSRVDCSLCMGCPCIEDCLMPEIIGDLSELLRIAKEVNNDRQRKNINRIGDHRRLL